MTRVKPAGEKTKPPPSAAGWQTTDIRSASTGMDMTSGFIADRFGKNRAESLPDRSKPSANVPLSFDPGIQGQAGRREGVTGSWQMTHAFQKEALSFHRTGSVRSFQISAP